METLSGEKLNVNDGFYMSGPTSSGRISLESLCFCGGVPTSSTRTLEAAAYDHDAKPTPSSNVFDEFEFQTSGRFNVDDCEVDSQPKSEDILHHGHKESFSAMAFADELFCDGMVMPLKPPPRLQYPNENKWLERQSSNFSSPRSPLKLLPFQRRSLWNDDFDPFMAALENVKEEKVGNSQVKYQRRSRSMSPLREISMNRTNDISGSNSNQHQQQIKEMGLILPSQPLNSNSNMEKNGEEAAKQVKLAKPKGVVFARKAMLVKMGNEKPRKLNGITPTMEADEIGVTTCMKKSKSKKLKNFLFRSGSMTKSRNATTDSKPNLTRNFSYKSTGLTQYNSEEKRVSHVSKVTLLQYRPKLLLCMGHSGKGKYLQ